MITTLYDDRITVLTWLRHAPQSWYQYLLELRGAEIKNLKQSTDMVEIARSQGRLDVLDKINNLREELEQ